MMDNFLLFKNLMVMALADGVIADEEARLLTHRAKKWGLTEKQVQEAIDNAASKEAEMMIPKTRREQITLSRELVHMMSIDGDLADVEKRLCGTAAATMNISAKEFDEILSEFL